MSSPWSVMGQQPDPTNGQDWPPELLAALNPLPGEPNRAPADVGQAGLAAMVQGMASQPGAKAKGSGLKEARDAKGTSTTASRETENLPITPERLAAAAKWAKDLPFIQDRKAALDQLGQALEGYRNSAIGDAPKPPNWMDATNWAPILAHFGGAGATAGYTPPSSATAAYIKNRNEVLKEYLNSRVKLASDRNDVGKEELQAIGQYLHPNGQIMNSNGQTAGLNINFTAQDPTMSMKAGELPGKPESEIRKQFLQENKDDIAALHAVHGLQGALTMTPDNWAAQGALQVGQLLAEGLKRVNGWEIQTMGSGGQAIMNRADQVFSKAATGQKLTEDDRKQLAEYTELREKLLQSRIDAAKNDMADAVGTPRGWSRQYSRDRMKLPTDPGSPGAPAAAGVDKAAQVKKITDGMARIEAALKKAESQ